MGRRRRSLKTRGQWHPTALHEADFVRLPTPENSGEEHRGVGTCTQTHVVHPQKTSINIILLISPVTYCKNTQHQTASSFYASITLKKLHGSKMTLAFDLNGVFIRILNTFIKTFITLLENMRKL